MNTGQHSGFPENIGENIGKYNFLQECWPAHVKQIEDPDVKNWDWELGLISTKGAGLPTLEHLQTFLSEYRSTPNRYTPQSVSPAEDVPWTTLDLLKEPDPVAPAVKNHGMEQSSATSKKMTWFCVGDKFYLCENKILCEYDYEERLVFASMANHPMLKRQIGPGGPQQQQGAGVGTGGHPHPIQNGIGGHGPTAGGQQQQQGQSQNSLMSQLVAGQRAAGGDHNNNSNLPVSLGGGGPSPFGTPTHMKAALSSAS
ncbi:AAEL013959-PA [Aedes aegypti]|uniref:AAEL013959-PA n=1 Tax=Aedes aegypti TaxID=7159 RepID=Q16HP3_AEDAE|nr:AAEL013959-PA [Aedes aegypti]